MKYYLKYHESQANKQNMIMTTYKRVLRFRIKSKKAAYTGWPTKISLFFFANNFYKNKENFEMFFPQLLEIYRILLVFVPCTPLPYNSTAASQTLKLSTTLLTISCEIHLISLLMISFFVCGLFPQALVFQVLFQKIVRRVEIFEIGWPGVIGLTRNKSVPWEAMPEVFTCSVLFEKYVATSFLEQST